MSLLDDDRPTNPAKHFINLKNGELSFYNKEAGENILVPTPFGFILLDQCATVKGWSSEEDTGYWANEVKRVGQEKLNVRTKNGLKASGLWKDIKDELKADGAVFHAVLYVAAQGRDGLEIQAVLLKGAALNAWVEFSKKNNLKTNKITLSDWADAKKGAVKYKVPVFTAEPMEDTERDQALELAKELRAYHNTYFSSNEQQNSEQVNNVDEVVDVDEDEPISLDDIPF